MVELSQQDSVLLQMIKSSAAVEKSAGGNALLKFLKRPEVIGGGLGALGGGLLGSAWGEGELTPIVGGASIGGLLGTGLGHQYRMHKLLQAVKKQSDENKLRDWKMKFREEWRQRNEKRLREKRELRRAE